MNEVGIAQLANNMPSLEEGEAVTYGFACKPSISGRKLRPDEHL